MIDVIRTATMPLVLTHVAVMMVINSVWMVSPAMVYTPQSHNYCNWNYDLYCFLQTLMNVLKELINVTNSATTPMVVIPATVLNLAIDFVVMVQLVKVSINLVPGSSPFFKCPRRNGKSRIKIIITVVQDVENGKGRAVYLWGILLEEERGKDSWVEET